MPSVKIDTIKTREAGNDIIALAKELKTEIDELFLKISNMPLNTREWIGPAATEYARIANLEKIQYNELIKSINKYGTTLINIANKYDFNLQKIGR